MSYNEDFPGKDINYISAENRRRFIVQPESKVWLISFTDVMALMLTFFVLIFSMISPERDIMGQVASVFKEQKQAGDAYNAGRFSTDSQQRLKARDGRDLEYLSFTLKQRVESDQLLSKIKIIKRDKFVIIKLPETLLFKTGSFEVSEDVQTQLSHFFVLLGGLKNKVEIQGYADPSRVNSVNDNYTTNWGLALQRAASVGKMVYDAGYRRNVALFGVVENAAEDIDYSALRRVEIVIHEYQDSLF